jgi:hypothetical protein
MAENRGRPGGRLGIAKGGSRRAMEKTTRRTPHPEKGEGLGRRRSTAVRPAGKGKRAHQAGGPDHHGLDAHEDRNP